MVQCIKSKHHNLSCIPGRSHAVCYCIKAVSWCRLCGPAWSGLFLKRGTWLIVFALGMSGLSRTGCSTTTPASSGPTLSPPPFSWLYPIEKWGKVVAASWGTELLHFLAALAILHQDELNNRLICTLIFNSSCKVHIRLFFKSSLRFQIARQGIEAILSPKKQWRPLSFFVYIFLYTHSHSRDTVLWIQELPFLRRVNMDKRKRKMSLFFIGVWPPPTL